MSLAALRGPWARVIAGFIVAPLAAPVVGLLFAAALFAIYPGDPIAGVPGFIELTAIIGYAAAVIIGLPLYLLLRLSRRRNLLAYVGAGLLAGVLTYELTSFGGLHGFVLEAARFGVAFALNAAWGWLQLEIPCAAAGALGGAAFWAIARPDKAGPVPNASHLRA